MPKASAQESHQSNRPRLDNALLALRKDSRVLRHRRAFADCFGANPVASALGSSTRRDPGAADRTYHGWSWRPLKTGTFYFARKRNFLLCLDRPPVNLFQIRRLQTPRRRHRHHERLARPEKRTAAGNSGSSHHADVEVPRQPPPVRLTDDQQGCFHRQPHPAIVLPGPQPGWRSPPARNAANKPSASAGPKSSASSTVKRRAICITTLSKRSVPVTIRLRTAF